MMILILILLFVLGLELVLLLKPNLSFGLLLGLGFPIGFGIWSILLFVLDCFGLPINNKMLLSFCCILLLLVFSFLIWRKKGELQFLNNRLDLKNLFLEFEKRPNSINPFYVTLFGLVLIIIFTIVSKTLYWPIMNYDSIDGYDLIAKLIGAEGKYNNTVFAPDNPIYTVRSFYPPLLVHALSIGYIFNGAHSKLIAVLFLLSTLIILYNLTLKNQSHIVAMVSVFLLCIVPEFMGQSALTASNPLSACYILMALGFFDQYLISKRKGDFYISLLALAFTIWTRTEAVIFAVPLFLIILKRNRKNIKLTLSKLSLLTVFTLVPFLTWQLFIKTLSSLPSAQPVIKKLFLDLEKLTDLLGQIKTIVFNTNMYALGFYFILFAILINLVFYKKSKATHAMTFILIFSFFMYVWVYYQLDTDYKIIHQGSWIGSGFKRGLFYFLPIGCYYIGKSFFTQMLFVSEKTKF